MVTALSHFIASFFYLLYRLFLNMNFNVNDNPLLVAPRPVRITTAPYPRALKIVHFDDTENDISCRIDTSPRASPRFVHLFLPYLHSHSTLSQLQSSFRSARGISLHSQSRHLSAIFPCPSSTQEWRSHPSRLWRRLQGKVKDRLTPLKVRSVQFKHSRRIRSSQTNSYLLPRAHL